MTETTGAPEASWLRWQHAAVRDLAWALASPPLLAPPAQRVGPGDRLRWLNSAWAGRAFRASEEWLAALDRHPAPLLDALGRRGDPRLGNYFEALLAFWLAWPGNPLYRLVRHNLPVRANNRTLGELDFLVEDRQSGELQHWEVAVKFYLGVAPGGVLANWIGPGLKDRLDLKVAHLLQHQLLLTRTPEGTGLLRHLGLPPPSPVCLLKGRLFYPPRADIAGWAPVAATPDHLRSWWMPQADFATAYHDSDLHWLALPKAHWLTPVGPDVPIGDARKAPDFIEALHRSADNRAIAVIGLAGDRETTRGFITPPDWPFPCSLPPSR